MAKNKPSKEPLPFLISALDFNNIDTPYLLKQKKLVRSWIEKTIKKEGLKTGTISFNFCSDDYLLEVNKEHLNHDFYTDIITFDFCENNIVSGDIYISIDRVKDNAQTEKQSATKELHRVIIHGVLHLCGYKDKKLADARLMREKEDYYLSLFP
jgi:probable rRNA maturation factor